MDYNKYIHLWLDGIYDEIKFWKQYIATKAVGVGCSEYGWRINTSPDTRFGLEEYLPEETEKVVKFIDVASGAFSRCGRVTNKCKLDITCVDSLGNIYEQMKRENKIDNGNKIQVGFVEILDKQFDENTFDIGKIILI